MKTTTIAKRKRSIVTTVGIMMVTLLVGAGILTFGNRTGFIRSANAKVETNAGKNLSCGNATLSGKYAVMGGGFVPGGPPPAPLVPFAVTSLMTMDGEGSLSDKVTVSQNGQISRNVNTGSYTVNADCTGSMTINIPNPPFQLTFDLVISNFQGNQGSEFYFIGTNGSAVVTHTAKRIP